MDPLSFAASLLTVIHGVHVTLRCIQKIKECRKAPQELNRIKTELQSLGALLEDIRDYIGQNPSTAYCDGLSLPIALASERIDTLRQTIESPAFRLLRLKEENKARLVWIRHKHRLAVLAEDLTSIKADITLRLNLITVSSTGRFESSINNLIRNHDVQAHQVSLLLQKLSESNGEHDQMQKLEDSLDPQFGDSLEQLDTAEVTMAKDSINDDNQISQIIASKDLSPTASGHAVFKKARHSTSCTCLCHCRGTYTSPIALRFLLGKLQVRYNGHTLNQCNCCQISMLYTFYHFPKYLSWRCISLTLQLNQFAGPELILRVSRTLPPHHPLWHYAITGDLDVVHSIYSKGLASPYDIGRDGTPALFCAIRQKSPDLAFFLIDQRVDFNFQNEAGITAAELLWDRAFSGYYGSEGSKVARRLIPGDDRIDEMNLGRLHKIVLGFMCTDLQTLLEAKTESVNSVDSLGRTALHWAVIRDDHDAVRDLLAYGADPNIRDRQGVVAMHRVQSGSVCRLLLNAKANIQIPCFRRNRCALQHVSSRPIAPEVLDLLVEAGGDVNASDVDDETALINAVFEGHTEIVRRLIRLGADVNAANASSRDTPIHFAAAFDHPDILPLLLENGADHTAVNVYGGNIGHNAAMFAGTEFVKRMARSDLRGLSLDVPDNEGKTARDYMRDRAVTTEREIGIHEAFRELLVSLAADGEDESDASHPCFDADTLSTSPDCVQLPGSFPL